MVMNSSQAAWALLVVAAILPFAHGGSGDSVLDVLGRPVVTGTEYTILPVNGGGLRLKWRNNSCPLNVVYNDNQESLPVIFTPYIYVKVITEDADLKVEFSAVTVCAQSTRWRLRRDSELEKTLIYAGNSSSSASSSFPFDLAYFRIIKSEGDDGNVYELSFCPHVCSTCKIACGSLGIYTDEDGNQWLVKESDINPLKVQFKRA
ncbi:hypothetical protein SUGI_0656170 [Cryptomeria japonica]|uniref:kunitz type trypsin inhibitor 111 n=1 Tax=Cryptomeria japonica TaxID=3369 RepID=UPI002414C20B|nr:kunitz type trypsin inhibitor 111 [Cryptomeria japonica]GLJ32620.1 hypothetical protein SUGI_0656170 [Cryptomeria japonica]